MAFRQVGDAGDGGNAVAGAHRLKISPIAAGVEAAVKGQGKRQFHAGSAHGPQESGRSGKAAVAAAAGGGLVGPLAIRIANGLGKAQDVALFHLHNGRRPLQSDGLLPHFGGKKGFLRRHGKNLPWIGRGWRDMERYGAEKRIAAMGGGVKEWDGRDGGRPAARLATNPFIRYNGGKSGGEPNIEPYRRQRSGDFCF